MIKNKKIIIIVIIIILSLLMILYGYYIIKKNANPEENNNKIIKVDEYIGYTFNPQFTGKNNYYINNGDYFIAFDKQTNEELFKINMNYTEIYNQINNKDIIKYYVKNENNTYKLYDIENNLIKESSRIIIVNNDYINNKTYYLYEGNIYNANNTIIYENLIKKLNINIEKENNTLFDVYGSFIYISYINKENINVKKLIDIENDIIYDVNSYTNYDTYIKYDINSQKENTIILDIKENKIYKYNNIEEKSYGIIVYNTDDDKKVLSNYNFIDYGIKISYYNYKFDYTVCDSGFKVYTENDKIIDNNCYDSFNRTADNIIYVFNKEDDSSKIYIKENKVYKKIPVGKYFINNYNNVTIYDKKDKEINNDCTKGFSYYRNNMYVCNSLDGSYILNDKLNKISDTYDSINCTDTYCSYKVDDKYGLLYEDEIITEPKYYSVLFFENSIIAEDEFETYIFSLGDAQPLNKEDINKKNNKYTNIDLNKIINENELNISQELIKNNEELFKKYSYIIVNNEGLKEYEKNLLNYFNIIVENRDYIDVDNTLFALKKLKIVIDKNRVDEHNASGLYDITSDTIFLRKSNITQTLSHEFVHFIYFSTSKNNNIYKFKDNYISEKEYKNLSKADKSESEVITNIEFNTIVEGGAEYYSAIYTTSNMTLSYPLQVRLMSIFNYIYGNDFNSKIFFSREGNYYLFKKMLDNNIKYEDIIRFNELSSIRYDTKRNSEELIFILDLMIDLYEKEKNIKWYEDEIFYRLILSFIPDDIKENNTNRLEEYKTVKSKEGNDEKTIINKIDKKYKIIFGPNISLYHNDLYYKLNAYIIDGDKRIDGWITVNYNPTDKKVIDYKFISN